MMMMMSTQLLVLMGVLYLTTCDDNSVHFACKKETGLYITAQPGAFLFLCKITVSYLYFKTLAYSKKLFLIKMSLIRMGSYVPAFI